MRRHPWTWGLGVGLGLALALTAAVREYAVRSVEDNVEVRQEAVVEEALTTIEKQFNDLRDELHHRARSLAEDSVVVSGLRDWHDREERPANLVHYIVNRSLDDRTSVEVYAPSPRLLAWNGTRMPLGNVPDEEAFPRTTQTAVVADGDERLALVAWQPVQRAGTVLGAVRVVRVIQYQPPVQNRYIRGYRLTEQWERMTGETVQVNWSSSPPGNSAQRVLRGVQGSVLGYVTVDPPSTDRLVERTAAFYDNFLAAWLALLIGWCIVLGVRWYLQLARREGLHRLPNARASAAQRLLMVGILWVGARYALLAIDVPARWVVPGTGLAPLFDPTHFASTIGGGIFQSIGDLLLTGLWAAGAAVGLLHLASRYRLRVSSWSELIDAVRQYSPRHPAPGRYLGTLLLLVGGGFTVLVGLAYVARRAVLDSTLDFFSRTGLLPEPLVLAVLCGLFLLVGAAALAGVGSAWIAGHSLLVSRPERWPMGLGLAVGGVIFGGVVAGLYLGTAVPSLVPLPYLLGAVGLLAGAALYGLVRPVDGAQVLTLQGLLVVVFGVTLLLYPLLYTGMDAQRREHMASAAQSFEEGGDPRVLYSIQEVLRAADEEIGPLFDEEDPLPPGHLDSVATQIVRRSLLASLTTYDVTLSLFDADGRVQRRYTPGGRVWRTAPTGTDQSAFALLRARDNQRAGVGPVIEQLPGGRRGGTADGDPFQYAGLLGLGEAGETAEVWALVRAEPQPLLPGMGTGVPRVLLPAGSFGDLYAELSLAEFRDGRLVRSLGRSFAQRQLQERDQTALERETAFWRSETVRERKYLTYYRQFGAETDTDASTVAVRIPAILTFDHLYYLLRLTVAGLFVGLVAYLVGLVGRYRQGRLPARRVRFRDKVLNAFLVVGIVSMVAVGVVGVRVVTGENERIIERRLQDQLNRVEETLAMEARPGEPLWRVADRMDVDSLAARVGLDFHLYEDAQLRGTSQPRLMRDGLIDERLPGNVYHTLYDEAYRFTTAEAAIDGFQYMVGYQALVDADGNPQLVVGVPTLAQQERVEEEQARTLAYLFGALLLLFIVVMLTAVVLANALAQPLAQLRRGLEAVGEGRFTQELPVNTRDELGDLVRTFNEMRAQLAESRRKLAQQERELAWREMARQVAHEIKNPLTPMRLSVQHLRRAFERTDGAEGDESRFAELFDRITGTLIEQIESLVRIANEFSTFARLPTRVLEPLDLNEVIREAARLMEEETADRHAIELDLKETPLVVEADREEMRRIYINLLKNAIQAIPDDRDGRVRVTTQCVEASGGTPEVQSEVIDNGTGIPPELQEKIFEPNFSTKTSGTGLGLAIAQKTIEELGGQVGFETKQGEGTTFWVRLPLAEEAEQIA